MKANDIRSLSADELKTRVAELRDEQFRLRFRSATETLESPLRLREVRRDIARVLTVMREQDTSKNGTTATTKTASKKTTSKTAAKAASTTATKRAAKTATKRATKTAR